MGCLVAGCYDAFCRPVTSGGRSQEAWVKTAIIVVARIKIRMRRVMIAIVNHTSNKSHNSNNNSGSNNNRNIHKRKTNTIL